jgi:hypothetical protein
MARHILKIIFRPDELQALPDNDVFRQNQIVIGTVPANPLPSLWTPGTSIIRQSKDWNKDYNWKYRSRPFSVLMDTFLNSKDSLNIYIEGS